MKENIKKIIIGVIILVLVIFGYNIFFTGNRDSSSLKAESEDPASSSEDGKVILNLLLSLKSLTLEASILDSLSFLSLIDFGQEIPDRPRGRNNPFSPLGQSNESRDDSQSF